MMMRDEEQQNLAALKQIVQEELNRLYRLQKEEPWNVWGHYAEGVRILAARQGISEIELFHMTQHSRKLAPLDPYPNDTPIDPRD